MNGGTEEEGLISSHRSANIECPSIDHKLVLADGLGRHAVERACRDVNI